MTTSNSATRVAIVTGGSRGIGRAVVERLASDGYHVVVGYRENRTEAEAALQVIREADGNAIAIAADVTDETSVVELFDGAEREFGGVDVVVHAAGVMALAPLADLDLDQLDRLLRVNVRGTFAVDQQAARRVRPGGAIINLSSSLTRFARPGYAAYTASKGAVSAITLILARELRGRDVTVNAVAPGPTATALFLEGKDEQTLAQIAAEAPLERVGTPQDAAELVAFLAGPARWINGQVLFANGGAI